MDSQQGEKPARPDEQTRSEERTIKLSTRRPQVALPRRHQRPLQPNYPGPKRVHRIRRSARQRWPYPPSSDRLDQAYGSPTARRYRHREHGVAQRVLPPSTPRPGRAVIRSLTRPTTYRGMVDAPGAGKIFFFFFFFFLCCFRPTSDRFGEVRDDPLGPVSAGAHAGEHSSTRSIVTLRSPGDQAEWKGADGAAMRAMPSIRTAIAPAIRYPWSCSSMAGRWSRDKFGSARLDAVLRLTHSDRQGYFRAAHETIAGTAGYGAAWSLRERRRSTSTRWPPTSARPSSR